MGGVGEVDGEGGHRRLSHTLVAYDLGRSKRSQHPCVCVWRLETRMRCWDMIMQLFNDACKGEETPLICS